MISFPFTLYYVFAIPVQKICLFCKKHCLLQIKILILKAAHHL